jgi:thiol-disulfide isomerase/thioredoxin
MKFDAIILIACLLALCAYYILTHYRFAPNETRMRAMVTSIASSKRPRVIYFFASWSEPCKHYSPKLKTAIEVYGNSIDYQSFNIIGTRSIK